MKKKHLSLVICCLVAVLFLTISAGCIGGGSDDPSLKNTLIYAGEAEDTMNPVLNSYSELSSVIFSGLMKYDANGKPIEDLAKSYTYDEAAMTYTFTLREGVTWHDGEPFTAEDAVFTYEVILYDETISATLTSNYDDIASVSAPNDYTFVVKMKAYNAAMLDYFTVGLLPEHLLQGKDINTDSFNQNPVGTGKYKFVEWDKAGGMIILERNTEYYGNVPNIERVLYKTVSVESTKATMLSTGEADLAWLNANYAKTFRGNPDYKNIDFKTADYRGLSMDFRTEFWQKNGDSIGVLNYALDKDAIVESVLDGRGVTAFSPIQLSGMGGNPEADIYSYDLDKFHEEMTKLGWTMGSDGIYERNGQKFHFTMQVRGHEEERIDIVNLCDKMLEEAGVDMEVIVVSKFEWDKGYNGFVSGYAAQFDPDMVYVNYVTGASENTMHYSNADVDRLLNEGRHEKDQAKREAIYAEFEEVYAESPGVVLTAYLDGNYVSIAGLSGLDTTRVLGHHAVGVMWNIEEWTLSK